MTVMRVFRWFLSFMLGLCFATGVWAHASLVSTDPPDGSILLKAPTMVELRFNEPVRPAVVHLIDALGKTRADARIEARDNFVAIILPSDLPKGTQTVSYRVVSADGHPVGGSIMFSVGAPTGDKGAAESSGHAVAFAIWIALVIFYAGLFVGVGGAFFLTWIAPAPTRLFTFFALGIGIVGAILSLGLQGLDLLGLSFAEIRSLGTWTSAMSTSLGPSLFVAATAILSAGLALLCSPSSLSKGLAVTAMIGVGVALASTGHASTAPLHWLTWPAVFLHVVGVAFWIGALAPLLVMTLRPSPPLVPALNRFSAVAIPVVAILVVAGVTLAVVQLASFAALVQTDYGRILFAKVVAVLGLLGLAALNRLHLTPALERQPLTTGPLSRSIAVEGILALTILGLVAGWRFTPPPRSIAALAALSDVSVHIHEKGAMVEVTATPGRPGKNEIVLQTMSDETGWLDAKGVTVTLTLPSAGIEPLTAQAKRESLGNWRIRDMMIPLSGQWHVRVDVLITDFDEVTLEDDVIVQ